MSVAFFLSTVTRNSAASIVGTVIFALGVRGGGRAARLGGAKPYLLPAQSQAWESLFGKSGESIGRAVWVCAI